MAQYDGTLLNAATSVAAGTSRGLPSGNKTFQLNGQTSSGTGSASVNVEGSNDGTNWLVLGIIALTLGTSTTSDILPTTTN